MTSPSNKIIMPDMNEPSANNPFLVDSLNHPLAGPIRKLLTREGRRELNQIIIDDEENIFQALEAGIEIESVYFSGDDKVSDALREKLTAGATIHEVAKRTTKKLFENDKLSRIFAIAETPKPIGLEKLKSITKDAVVLEDVSISGNIGNIIRTSLALGVGGMILLNMDPLDMYDRRLIRASRGYLFSLPVMTATASQLIDYCKQNDQTLLVTSADAEKTVDEISSIPERLLIVFGSEKEGCSPEIENAASLKVRIPINEKVESLNVSAAAGITLFNRVKYNQQ
ncbi:MAG TPA: TrmH family RNA methyltransferase [Anaerolineales bacterium]|nr:TrmH family RNA methyltransferase [Anaerolineales bacterium]HQX15703.1 TrmH family RNA methyltransferase [Anaerolineales bacterium]